MKIERYSNCRIRIIDDDKGFIESQSVESQILFSIYNKLEEIRCCIIDVETAIEKPPNKEEG